MGLTTDRPGEVQHAKTHKNIIKAPMHSTQFSSYTTRAPEIEKRVEDIRWSEPRVPTLLHVHDFIAERNVACLD